MKIFVFLVAFMLVAAAVPPEKSDKENLKEFLFVSMPSPAPETYNPVFPANADSVIIPLKKAGRLFLIEAKVEDQTGNLVFGLPAIAFGPHGYDLTAQATRADGHGSLCCGQRRGWHPRTGAAW